MTLNNTLRKDKRERGSLASQDLQTISKEDWVHHVILETMKIIMCIFLENLRKNLLAQRCVTRSHTYVKRLYVHIYVT